MTSEITIEINIQTNPTTDKDLGDRARMASPKKATPEPPTTNPM